jgi:hypothetical protein
MLTVSTTSAPAKGISISTIPQETVNQTFTVNGSLSNYSAAPTLQYQDNSTSTWTALPAGSTVSTTSFSFTHPAFTSAGSYTVGVRDANATSVKALSNTFQVVQAGGSGPVVSGNLMADFGTKTGAIVYPQLFGVSTGGLENSNFSVCSNATFQNLVSALNLPCIRLHGQWMNALPYSYAMWSNFVTNVNKLVPSTCSIVLGFWNPVDNLINPSTSQTQSFVASAASDWKAHAPAGYNIAYWEGPNEPNGHISAQAVADQVNAVVAGAQSVYPTALGAGPTTAGFEGNFLGTLISNMNANTLGMMDFHQYLWCQCCNDSQPSDQQVCAGVAANGTNPGSSGYSQSVSTAAGTYAAKLPILMGEFNIEACANDSDTRAGTIVGACFLTSYLLDCVVATPSNPLWGAIWDIYDDAKDNYNLIDINFNTYPEYWMLKQLIATMSGSMVSVTSKISGVKIWAVMNGVQTMGVAIVNSNGNSVSSQVALSRWPLNGTGNASIHQWQISSNNPQGVLNTITVTGGMTPSITFPAQSVTILYP